MRRCLWRLCGSSVSAAPSSVPLVLNAPRSKVAQLYEKCLDPQSPPSDVVRFSTELLPFIEEGGFGLRQKLQLLNALATRSVRNENVIQRCLWDTFKTPLPTDTDTSGGLSLLELAAYTSRAFRVMAEQQFVNDPQLTAIALGRCVELAPHLTLRGVHDAYRGLRAINHLFFSTAEVAHHTSEVTANMTVVEFHEQADTPDAETLRNQPNLIDVLCGELEEQLRRCVFLLGKSGATTQLVPLADVAGPSSPSSSTPCETAEEAHDFLGVLECLAVVGVQQASTLSCLASHVPRLRGSVTGGFFIRSLDAATVIAERVVDPLNYEESASVRDARRQLTLRLSDEVHRMPRAVNYLRHHPSEVLLLRRLFEREAGSCSLSPALWDTVRGIRVAHRHCVTASTRSPRPTGGLFDKKYAVKVKPISVDNSESEKFVPPQFKTWRSPAATPRGGHRQQGRAPRRVAFGTQRISKNYIQNKRKKYCPF